MKRIFAGANYWAALLNPRDQWHTAAVAAEKRLKNAHVVTTDEVLGEVLTLFCKQGPDGRRLAADLVEALQKDPRVTVVEQSRASFGAGLACYKRFNDKKWSFADCISIDLMRRDSITEALTNDHHFEQAGFEACLK